MENEKAPREEELAYTVLEEKIKQLELYQRQMEQRNEKLFRHLGNVVEMNNDQINKSIEITEALLASVLKASV